MRDTRDGGAWRNYAYDGRLTFTYDAAEQPTSMGGAASGAYVYDGNLKRVKQTIDGQTIYSFYSRSGALLQRVDADDSTRNVDYIRVAGLTAIRLHGGGASYREEHPHQDHLGSPAAATDSGGNVLWREQYTPFGEKRLDPALNFDNVGFTGHIDDAATGLTYMQARYYDPVIGRFLSNDPVAFAPDRSQYFNRYSYALNDPVNAIDPDGKQATFLEGLAEAVAEKGTEEEKEAFGQGVAQGVGASAGALPVGRAAQGGFLAGRGVVGGLLLRQGAGKSFDGASKFIANTTQGFAKTGGKAGNVTFQSFGKGGRSGGEKLFQTLTNQKGPIDASKTITGKLKDGSVANIRTRTLKDGRTRTTVEVTRKVTRSDSRIQRTERVKVRFDE